MSQDKPVTTDHRPPDDQLGGDSDHIGLAWIQQHVVALLGQLERPPRTLRIEAGEVSVDISWPDTANGNGDNSTHSPSSGTPTGDAGERSGEVDKAGATGDHLVSPAVGVFYHAREPGAEPLVSVGSLVRPGQQIGIVEAMKLMIPIEADRAGRVTAVLKGNGEAVEYGEPLFALDGAETPDGSDV